MCVCVCVCLFFLCVFVYLCVFPDVFVKIHLHYVQIEAESSKFVYICEAFRKTIQLWWSNFILRSELSSPIGGVIYKELWSYVRNIYRFIDRTNSYHDKFNFYMRYILFFLPAQSVHIHYAYNFGTSVFVLVFVWLCVFLMYL